MLFIGTGLQGFLSLAQTLYQEKCERFYFWEEFCFVEKFFIIWLLQVLMEYNMIILAQIIYDFSDNYYIFFQFFYITYLFQVLFNEPWRLQLVLVVIHGSFCILHFAFLIMLHQWQQVLASAFVLAAALAALFILLRDYVILRKVYKFEQFYQSKSN